MDQGLGQDATEVDRGRDVPRLGVGEVRGRTDDPRAEASPEQQAGRGRTVVRAPRPVLVDAAAELGVDDDQDFLVESLGDQESPEGIERAVELGQQRRVDAIPSCAIRASCRRACSGRGGVRTDPEPSSTRRASRPGSAIST